MHVNKFGNVTADQAFAAVIPLHLVSAMSVFSLSFFAQPKRHFSVVPALFWGIFRYFPVFFSIFPTYLTKTSASHLSYSPIFKHFSSSFLAQPKRHFPVFPVLFGVFSGIFRHFSGVFNKNFCLTSFL